MTWLSIQEKTRQDKTRLPDFDLTMISFSRLFPFDVFSLDSDLLMLTDDFWHPDGCYTDLLMTDDPVFFLYFRCLILSLTFLPRPDQARLFRRLWLDYSYPPKTPISKTFSHLDNKVSWCSWLSHHLDVVRVPGSNPGGTIFNLSREDKTRHPNSSDSTPDFSSFDFLRLDMCLPRLTLTRLSFFWLFSSSLFLLLSPDDFYRDTTDNRRHTDV